MSSLVEEREFIRTCTEDVTARDTYDDMIISQVNQGVGDTLFLLTPGDDHLALDVLHPAMSHDGQVVLAGGLCKLDVVRVEVIHLQATKARRVTLEGRRNEARPSDEAPSLVLRLTGRTPETKVRGRLAPVFPVHHAPERHRLERSKDVFDEHDDRSPNSLLREVTVRDRIDDHDL